VNSISQHKEQIEEIDQNNEWEHIGKDRPTFLKLNINGSVIVNIISYIRGVSPAQAEELELNESLITEINRYGKYPNTFKLKIVSQEGTFEKIPTDKVLTWTSKCPDSYSLLDRLDRGNIPDTKHGSNVCQITRLSEKKHRIDMPKSKDQLYTENILEVD